MVNGEEVKDRLTGWDRLWAGLFAFTVLLGD